MTSPAAAVVIVSGGSAISPFTTPEAGCAVGQAAGSSDTFLRAGLLAAGFDVFTSPASPDGVADADPGFAGFSGPPEVLPPELTVNPVGSLDDAGGSLARYLAYLSRRYGYGAFHLVAHSMGGLFSRAALRILATDGSALKVRSLITLGTPWTGAFAADHRLGDLARDAIGGDERVEALLAGLAEEASGLPQDNAADQVTRRYLAGPAGWNERQAGVLDHLEVTLVAGDLLSWPAAAGRQVSPNDGLVATASALAEEVSAAVLPRRVTRTFPDAHSVFFCNLLGIPWERALTWDPDVLGVVIEAIQRQ
jgi:pimeloyl-ACP methyl ester carboxylesterase